MMLGPHRRSDDLPPHGDAVLAAALRRHVHVLATEIGERNVAKPLALTQARDYVQSALGGTLQSYEVRGVTCDNVVLTLPGETPESVVVGAHYDSVIDCPGANDNGSGVAALLELALRLQPLTMRRTLHLVAFVNEEPPWFDTALMGSYVYAAAARARGETIHAMLSLETLGCYCADAGSQKYPPPLGLLFPSRGNFITVVGNLASAALIRRISQGLIDASGFPVESIAAPGLIPGVDWSDHGSFWKHGYHAVMLTDTAPYRYQQYHTPEDTEDRVDYSRLAALTEALVPVIRSLVD